jgi:hypothetical protein
MEYPLGGWMNDLFPVTNKPDEFELFWSIYPRKVGKLVAQKALKNALKSAKLKDIIDAVRSFSDLNKDKDKQFIPHPATWLNAGRWMDETDKPKPQTTTKEEWDAVWKWRLKDYKPGKFWSSHWGTRPEHGGSDIPKHLMDEWERMR